jgi:hypothetical protein
MLGARAEARIAADFLYFIQCVQYLEMSHLYQSKK